MKRSPRKPARKIASAPVPAAKPPARPAPVPWNPAWGYPALLLVPVVLWLLNPNWTFQSMGHMDPWYYFGHFLHFPRFQNASPTYGGERMTWILPGLILTRLFGPAGGVALLHASVMGASLCAFYCILKRLTEARTAFLTAVLLGGHPMFIGANGWDYVDSASTLYQLLALAFLCHAASARRPFVFLVLSAASWWAVVYTYLAWLALTPGYLYLLWRWGPEGGPFERRALRLAAVFAAGLAITTAYMAGAYYGLGAHGAFFSNNLRTAFQIAGLNKNPWLDPAWLGQAFWLVFPAIAFSIAIASLLRERLGLVKFTAPQRDALLYYVYCATMMIVLTVRQSRLLAFDYFASILLTGTFLTLGIALYRVPVRVSTGAYAAALAAAFGIGVFPLTRPMLYFELHRWKYALALAVAIGVATLARWIWPANRTAWAACLLALAVLTFGLTPAYPSRAWKMSYDGWSFMQRVARAVDLITVHTPPGKYPVFWFDDEKDPLTAEYRSIWCALEARRPAMLEFPEIDPKNRFAPGDRLVVMDRRPERIDAAPARLAAAGIAVAPGGRDRIESPDGAYWLAYFDVLKAGR